MNELALHEKIYEMKWTRKYNWNDISQALQLGVSEDTMQKRYKRLCEKLGKPYKPVKPTEHINTQTITVVEPTEDFINDDPMDLINRTKYGDLKPTNYVSQLSNDEWILKYVPHLNWKIPYLTELREKMWNLDDIMVLLPRGHGKSDTSVALFCRWILEVKKPLLIVTASASLAKDIFIQIDDFLTDPEIRADYGDIVDKANLSDLKLYYVDGIDYKYRDAPLRCATQQTKLKGAHPVWIHFDDVIDGEYLNSASNDATKKWFTKTIKPMRRHSVGNKTKLSVVATRQGIDDLYKYLIDKHKLEVIHYESLWKDDNDEWCTLECPEWTLEALLEYKESDPIAFQEQMQNNPVPNEGIYFDNDDWREYNEGDVDLSEATWYIAVDPATGMTDTADFMAIMAMAILDGNLYVHDGLVKRKMRFDDQMKEIHRLNNKYNPSMLWIEKVMAQQIHHQQMDYLSNVRSFTHTQPNAKYQRIDAIPFNKHVVYVNKDAQFYTEMLIEFRSYDQKKSTDSKKDDALDAVSMIVFKHGRYLSGGNSIDWSKRKMYADNR